MNITRRSFGGFALGSTALAAMAACSDGESSGAPADPATAQGLTIAVAALPVNLDVLQNSAEGTIVGPMQHVLEPLVKRNGTSFEPCLADSWENPDELTWIFHINPDTTFSDGSPLTAEDARASLQRLIDLESPLAPLLAAVDSIESDDDSTLTISTSSPLGTLLTTLSQILIGKGATIDDDSYWAKPVGTGPFVINEFVADQRLVLDRNADYWGPATALNSITFVGMPEETARISALSTGEADIIIGLSPDSIPELESLDSIVFDSVPNYATLFIWFNSSMEPFTDIRVRHALWHALDLEQIVANLFGGHATVAQAPIPQPVFGAPALETYTYDPDLAKQLLTEAGYPNGISTSIQFSSSGDTTPFVQTIVSQWAAVGVTVDPLAKEKGIWLEDLLALNWDMNTQGATVTTGDADYHLGRLYTTDAERLGYSNPEYDALVSAARESVDQEERIDLYAEASQILWDDAPAIWVADQTSNVAYRDHLTNVTIDPGNRNNYSGVVIADA